VGKFHALGWRGNKTARINIKGVGIGRVDSVNGKYWARSPKTRPPRAATFRRLKGVRFSLCIRPLRGVYCARSHNRRLFALRGQGPTDTSAACALLPWAARTQPHPSRTAHQGTISACGCVFYANPRPSCKLLEITRGTLPIFSSYIVKCAADRRARNTIRRPMRLTGIPPMFCAWRMYAHGLRTGRAIGQPAF
jgi:hypothetical protein